MSFLGSVLMGTNLISQGLTLTISFNLKNSLRGFVSRYSHSREGLWVELSYINLGGGTQVFYW